MTSYITIYTPTGDSRDIYPVTRDSEISCTLMGDTFIKVVFNHPVIIDFKAGSFISHNQRKWSLLNNYKPESLASGNGYKYELKFYAEQHQLQRCILFWKQGNTREASFNLTTRLQNYAQLICDNINYYSASTSYLDNTIWSVGNIPAGLSEKCIYQAFDGVSCWDALMNIANAFEVEWWVEDHFASSTATLHFGRCENGDAVEFAEGGIVSKMPASKRGEDAKYGTRFYVYGGTQNIPDDYYTSQDGGVTNHVSAKRLHIPSTYPTPYIDSKDNLKSNEVIEKVVILDDIFPNNTETIDEVTTRTETKDGVETTYFKIRCENSTFNPSTDRLSESLGAKFLTGSLQGREYDLIPDTNFRDTKTFEIVARNEGTGDTSIITPNQYLKPKPEDTFVLTGVKLSSQRIYDAEEQLLIAGQAIAYKNSADREVYECPTDPVYCSQNNHNFQLGQRVTLVGAAFGDGRISRIQGYTKKLWNEYEATYSVGDNARYTRFGAISVIASNIKTDTIKQFQSLQNKTYRVSTELRVVANSTGNVGNLERKVGILIGDDHDMSAREIAEDVVASSGGGGGGGTTPLVKISSTDETYIGVESELQNEFTIIPKVLSIDDYGTGPDESLNFGLAKTEDVITHLEPILDRVENGTSNLYTKMVEIASGCIHDRSGDIEYALPSASEEFKNNADQIIATNSYVDSKLYIIPDISISEIDTAIDNGENALDALPDSVYNSFREAVSDDKMIYIRTEYGLDGLVPVSVVQDDFIYIDFVYEGFMYSIDFESSYRTTIERKKLATEELDIITIGNNVAESTRVDPNTILVLTQPQTYGRLFNMWTYELDASKEFQWGVRLKVGDDNTGTYEVVSDVTIAWRNGVAPTFQNGVYYEVLLTYKNGTMYGEYSAYGSSQQSGNNVFYLDFDSYQISGIYDGDAAITCNVDAIVEAVSEGKTILMRYDRYSPNRGNIVVNTFVEDLVYLWYQDGARLVEVEIYHTDDVEVKGVIDSGSVSIHDTSLSKDVYVADFMLPHLKNSEDVPIKFFTLRDAVISNKVIMLTKPYIVVNAEFSRGISGGAPDRIKIQVVWDGYIYTAEAYEDTQTIKANSKTSQHIATYDYVDSLVGNINTLLETIIAG